MRQCQGKMWWPLGWPDTFMKFNMLWIGSVNLLSVLMNCQRSVVQLSLSVSKEESKGKGWVYGSLIDGSQKITTQILTLSSGSPQKKKKNPNPEMLALCLLFHESKKFFEYFSRKDPKHEVTSKIKEPPNTGQDTKLKFHIHFTFTLKNQFRSQLFNRGRDNATMPGVKRNGIAVSRSLFKTKNWTTLTLQPHNTGL